MPAWITFKCIKIYYIKYKLSKIIIQEFGALSQEFFLIK